MKGGPPAAAAAAAAILGGIATGLVRNYATARGVLDLPNERSSHSVPTPRGGGLGLIGAAALCILLAHAFGLVRTRDVAAMAPAILVAATGWMDDSRGLRARTRLIVHFAAAALAVGGLGGLSALSIGTSVLQLGAIGSVLAVLAIVWSLNLFNFMDGIDGLAGSQAVLVLGTAAALFEWQSDRSLSMVAAIVAGASLGFLWWNWPPAKIFMGDVGSGTLGFIIAVAAIAGEKDGSVPIMAIIIANGVFVVDATLTLLRRLVRGVNPTQPHREHAYQRLSRSWSSHRSVTLLVIGINILLAVLSVAFVARPDRAVLFIAASVALLLVTWLAVEWRAPIHLSSSHSERSSHR